MNSIKIDRDEVYSYQNPSKTMTTHLRFADHAPAIVRSARPVKIVCEEGGTPAAVTLVHALQNWSHPNTLGCYPFLPHDITRSITELVLVANRETRQVLQINRLKNEASSLGSGAPVPWSWMYNGVTRQHLLQQWVRQQEARRFATMPSVTGPISLYDTYIAN